MAMGKVALTVVLGWLCFFVGSIQGQQQGNTSPTSTTAAAPTTTTTPLPIFSGAGGINILPASDLENNALLIEWCSNTTAYLTKLKGCNETQQTDECYINTILRDAIAKKKNINGTVEDWELNPVKVGVNRTRLCSFYSTLAPTPSTTTSSTTAAPSTTSSTSTDPSTTSSTPTPTASPDLNGTKSHGNSTTGPPPAAPSGSNDNLKWIIPLAVIGSLALCILIGFILHRYSKRAGWIH